MTNKLMAKMLKNTTLKHTSPIKDSVTMNSVDETSTSIPALNIALSASLTGGLKSGIMTIAAPSKHFKSASALVLAGTYLKKHKDGVLMFFDSEFGSPIDYFNSADVDLDRVVHIPVKNLEELKFELVAQLENLTRGDKVFILIDSIGNLASKKEVEDAKDGKSTADMTRSKTLKSIYRIITTHLRMLDIPLVQITHTYETMELYSKTVVGGGTGITYASDQVWVLTKAQEKDTSGLTGFKFTIVIDKSRYVREKSKIPLYVDFEKGISKYSGLLDIAIEAGCIIKPSNGWYSRVDDDGVVEQKKSREKETNTAEFWAPVLKSKRFTEYLTATYKISHGSLVSDDVQDDLVEDAADSFDGEDDDIESYQTQTD